MAFIATFPLIWGLLVGLFLTFYPTFLSGFQTIQGDPGDVRFNHYVLEHGYRWIKGYPLHSTFWNPPIFFPTPNTLAYSDILLSAGPFYWMWRIWGISEETSFQLWMITLATLNYFSAYFTLKRGFKFALLPSSVGAFLFAFASSRLNHLSHPQFFPAFYTPLAFYFFAIAFQASSVNRVQNRIRLFLGILMVVLQIYAAFYLGWFLLLILGVATLIALMIRESRKILVPRIKKDFVFLLFSCGIALALLAPLLSHYMVVAHTVGLRPLSVIREPKLQSWLYLGDDSVLYFWQDFIRGFQVIRGQEQKIGLGLVTYACCFLGFFYTRKTILTRIACGTFLTLFVLTTSFFHFGTLWHWVFPWIPGAGAVRALSRIGLGLLPIPALGLASFFQHRFQQKELGRMTLFILALLAFLVLEQARFLQGYSKSEWHSRPLALAQKLSPQCQSFFYLPTGEDPEAVYKSLDAMWATLFAEDHLLTPLHIPTINGYSGNAPTHWSGSHSSPTTSEWLSSWIQRNQLNRSQTCLLD